MLNVPYTGLMVSTVGWNPHYMLFDTNVDCPSVLLILYVSGCARVLLLVLASIPKYCCNCGSFTSDT